MLDARSARTRSSPSSSTGEVRKRSTIRFGFPAGRAPRTRAGSDVLARRLVGLVGIEMPRRLVELGSAGSTITSARSSSPSSSSSGFVNAACTGPRRPRITISSTASEASTSIAWSAVSVARSSSTLSASIRAQSIATLPLPTTTTCSQPRSNSRSGWSGWPLYQPTNVVAASEPGRSSPGMPEPPVDRRADRVEHRVVVLEQVGAMQVAPELDACRRSGSARARRSSRRRASPT